MVATADFSSLMQHNRVEQLFSSADRPPHPD